MRYLLLVETFSERELSSVKQAVREVQDRTSTNSVEIRILSERWVSGSAQYAIKEAL
jgi:hypothetical protein